MYPDVAGSIVYGREISCLINNVNVGLKNTYSLAKRKFLLLVSTQSEYLPNYLIGQFSSSLIFLHQVIYLFPL